MPGHLLHSASPRRSRRRLFLSVVAAAAAAIVVAACAPEGSDRAQPAPTSYRVTTTQAASGRPNIVFVLTDDLSKNLISQMPAVQSLQQSGASLSHYYVVDSLCCPSRSAIFTGEYPHDDGVFTNSGKDGGYATYNAHGDQSKSFAVALQKSGYQTAMMGKYLNGYQPSDPIPPGWNQWDVAGNGYPALNYN